MKRKKSNRPVESQQNLEGNISKAVANPLLPIALLVFVCLVVYANSLSNGFVFDDFGAIVENKYLGQPGKLLASLFSHSYFAVAGLEASYRPVATLSYFLIYSIAGLDPFYYHLASLLLHTINAVLVYCLANLILQHRLNALIAGLLFATHPALSEAVNCIDFNDDLLAAFFFLLAFIGYVRLNAAEVSSRVGNYSLTLIFFFFGLLSKEMAITLPAMVILYDLVLRDADRQPLTIQKALTTLKKRVHVYAGYLAVSLIYIIIRFLLLVSPDGYLESSYGGLFERIIYLPGHIFSFIKLALFPSDLTADYVFAYPNSFFDSLNLIGVAVVVGLAGASFFIYRYSKAIFFGIWWFLITLLPVSNLIEIYNPFAERYLYIPMIGFCLVVPIVISGLVGGRFTKPSTATLATLIPALAIISVYSFVTISRNPDWRNNFVLWSKTVQSSPDSLIAHGGLGRAYQDQGKLDAAIKEFEIALELNPKHAKTFYNLGVAYHQKGDLEKAVENFSRSVALDPNTINAHYNLGTIYHKQGRVDLAIQHYVKVTELDPEDIDAHYRLGVAYAMQGKLNRAVLEWEKVLQIDPHHSNARSNLKKANEILKGSGGVD
ncbi:MAG: tetratricopeptide repeat protein [Desulfobacterales bacterium]|jgi:tetratricopeptide (TPR) repeat protein